MHLFEIGRRDRKRRFGLGGRGQQRVLAIRGRDHKRRFGIGSGDQIRLLGIGAAIGAALGGLVAYVFDPQSGKARRHGAASRTAGALRLHPREEPKEFDDVTLARKVETEIFRDADVPKGQIVVNAQEGVVQLRGEVEDMHMLEALVAKAADVQGVQDVENLLHLPGVPAPMHQ